MQKILRQAFVQGQLVQSQSATLAAKQATQTSFLMFNVRAFSNKVFVEGLPLDWTDSQLENRLKAAGNITQLRLFTNSQGQTTGKAFVEFESDEAAEKAITDFNDVEIEGLQHKARPFVDRKAGGVLPDRPNNRIDQDPETLAKRVYLTNVAYGATEEDITELVGDIAEIEKVVVPKDRYVIHPFISPTLLNICDKHTPNSNNYWDVI